MQGVMKPNKACAQLQTSLPCCQKLCTYLLSECSSAMAKTHVAPKPLHLQAASQQAFYAAVCTVTQLFTGVGEEES